MGLFASLKPALFLVVQAGAPPGGACTPAQPCGSIQAAVNLARPGTAILVRAGRYDEAVKFPSRAGGTDAAPIWLVSADGPQAAKVVAPPGAKAVIQGLGVHDVAVVGFEVEGGENGVQFGMSGDPARNPAAWSVPHATVARVAVVGNRVHGQRPGDGIKVSQADEVEVTDNTVSDVGDQCIDFVAVNRGTIAHNDCAGAGKAAAIFAKAGSEDVTIAYNHVHDVTAAKVAGISLGGWSGAGYAWPSQADFEARRLRAVGNRVERVNGYPLVVLGAQDSVVENNVLDASASTGWAVVGINHGTPGQAWSWPRGVTFRGNALVGRPTLFLLNKEKDGDGRSALDPARDGIALQAASARANPEVGPRPFTAWAGQRGYPLTAGQGD